MKKVFFLLATFCTSLCFGQLKTTQACPDFSIDLLKGRVGDLEPTSTIGQIKSKYPCFSRVENESDSAWCGGGVFYKDRDLYFFTGSNYIEIGPAYKGKLSLPLMGASRNNLFNILGNPMIKDVNWDVYQTAYGIMLLYFTKANKVNKIRFSTENTGSIKLCE